MATPEVRAIIYRPINIDKLLVQIQGCSSVECLANSTEVVKEKLLASQQGERARFTDEVIPLLEQRLNDLGQDVGGLVRMGDGFLSVNESDRALEYYTQALRLNPMYVMALVGTAKAYAVSFQKHLRTVSVPDSNAAANLKKAFWLPALENIFFAMEFSHVSLDDKLAEIKKIFAEAWFEKGYACLNHPPFHTYSDKKYAIQCAGLEAAISFDCVLEIYPQSAKALMAKSVALEVQSRVAEAELWKLKAEKINYNMSKTNYFLFGI